MAGKGWFQTTIGEQATLQRGIDITRKEQRPGRVPVVSSGGTGSYHDTAHREGPGVVLGRKGVVGSVWFIDEPYWPHDTTLWVKDFHGNNERFVYYFFKSIAPRIVRMDVGSANPTLNRNHVHPIQVKWPPLPEQKAIAHVLGTLDDKIELNRRMNETLEAMARAIFKSWFVDFDPVRAKMDGRQPPGLDPQTAALFPDSLEHTPTGELIPKGWSTEAVGDVVRCVGGGTPSTKEATFWKDGDRHWATPKDLSGLTSPILFDTDRKITDAGLAKISSGLLPPGTLLLSSRAPVGYLAVAQMPVAVNQGFIAMVCNDRATNLFMLHWCRHNMDQIEGRASGTTFQEISKKNFRPIRILLPSEDLVAAFTESVRPMYARMTENLRQSQTLAALRDTLLPKLLSGELEIEDAEKFVKEVA